MKNAPTSILITLLLVAMATGSHAAGFRVLQVEDTGKPELEVGLWYPSVQPVAEKPNTEFELAVALEAPIAAANGGLILLSHGFGGWYGGHADTAAALAAAGYVVAAPSHAGNTWSDMSSSIDQWALDRPRHISRVIDHMLADEIYSQHIDANKIGVYGFSAGGYTALNLIGAVPDLDHAHRHCQEQPQEFACAEGMISEMRGADMQRLSDSSWGADARISAASISAPGLGFSYTRESLARVSARVQLWSGELDDSVPTQTNALWLATRLPESPETHWIKGANHFAFMVVACRDAFKQADPQGYATVCDDADGFDRREFHHDMHREMVRFFDSSLGIR